MKKLLIFNWKMAPDSLKEARRLLNSILNSQSYILNSEIVVAPPFVYLSNLSKIKGQKSKVALAAQNVFWEDSGAYTPLEVRRHGRLPMRKRIGLLTGYTGEISASILKNLGVEYVLIGHSERRKYLNETDEMINKKVLTTLKAGLKVILCVGEPKRELGIKNYELGIKKAKNYIENQLQKDLKNVSLNSKSYILNSRLIIAYEPIWAINTGHSDTPKDALEMIRFIKKTLNSKFSILNSRVLYGGSVNSKNIGDFLNPVRDKTSKASADTQACRISNGVKHSEIDGVLIGHASLKTTEVKKIIEIVSKIV